MIGGRAADRREWVASLAAVAAVALAVSGVAFALATEGPISAWDVIDAAAGRVDLVGPLLLAGALLVLQGPPARPATRAIVVGGALVVAIVLAGAAVDVAVARWGTAFAWERSGLVAQTLWTARLAIGATVAGLVAVLGAGRSMARGA